MGHELVGLLGGRVERHRRVHAIPLGERHLLVAAVDRRGGCVHEVPDRVPAARLEHVEEPDEVGVDVGARVLDGVAHPRLCGEVNDDAGAYPLEERLHRRLVGQIAAHELEAPAGEAVGAGVVRAPARRLGEHPQPVLLDAHVVVVVHVVEAHDARAGRLEQPFAEERANKTGGSGNEDHPVFMHAHSFLL